VEEAVRARMVGRLHPVGSSPETAPLIEGSFTRLIGLLETALKGRAYLFGGRPSLADFGLAAQLKQLLSDPTPGALLKAQAPGVVAWIERMEHPRAEGGFEALDVVRGPLGELLRTEVAGAYLTWMAANAQAVAADAPGVSIDLGGVAFVQKPQRYAAKAFAELRRKRALAQNQALAALLEETGCDAFLTGASAPSADDADESDDDDDGDGDED
jgi:hypothetical protein